MSDKPLRHPVTPDGRYFVVKGRLWRLADPRLSDDDKANLVSTLMRARRAVKSARQQGDAKAEATAHQDVDVAKIALGERGAVWWTDGEPDLNRHLVKNTSYASWFAALTSGGRAAATAMASKPASTASPASQATNTKATNRR